jgi:hypothetical protein
MTADRDRVHAAEIAALVTAVREAEESLYALRARLEVTVKAAHEAGLVVSLKRADGSPGTCRRRALLEDAQVSRTTAVSA